MPRFLIEREVVGIGAKTQDELADISKASNAVLFAMQKEGKHIQWESSFVTVNGTVCVYLAENEDLIAEHASRSGFGCTNLKRAVHIIDPSTADGG